jgi:hypothetical protein
MGHASAKQATRAPKRSYNTASITICMGHRSTHSEFTVSCCTRVSEWFKALARFCCSALVTQQNLFVDSWQNAQAEIWVQTLQAEVVADSNTATCAAPLRPARVRAAVQLKMDFAAKHHPLVGDAPQESS